MKKAWFVFVTGVILLIMMITWIIGKPSLRATEKIFAVAFSVYMFLPGLIRSYIYIAINSHSTPSTAR